jgi:AraC-like DNA-binding protein
MAEYSSLVEARVRKAVCRMRERLRGTGIIYPREVLGELYLSDSSGTTASSTWCAFVAVTGAGPADVLSRERVAYACELMQAGHSATAAAHIAGFHDSSKLTHAFRRWLGVGPRQWMKASKKGTEMRDKMTQAVLTIAVLLLALPASAQVAYDFDRIQPGEAVADRPGCTWQWDRSTVGPWGGWFQACAQPALPAHQALPEAAPPPSPMPSGGHACGAYNPYADPAGMMACIAAQPAPPTPVLPPVHVGLRYYLGYPSQQVQVLAIITSLDGVQVITYQWLVAVAGHDAGDVSACRYGSTTGRSTCAPFIPMQ